MLLGTELNDIFPLEENILIHNIATEDIDELKIPDETDVSLTGEEQEKTNSSSPKTPTNEEYITNETEHPPNYDKLYHEALKRKKASKLATLLDRDNTFESYLVNTTHEELALEYVENFRNQYARIFPARKDLLLSPENEFGVKKFICTTIKPIRLPFKDLYDYKICAKFVSNYITYEQLDPPYSLPSKIPSPSFIMAYQNGNSFDMSILLTCLLRGAGYNAYVVSGYASKKITTIDDTKLSADVKKILDTYDTTKTDIDFEKIKQVDVNVIANNGKYKVKETKDLKSSYIEKQREKIKMQVVEKEKAKLVEIEELQQLTDEIDDDELFGLRVHAWVMILPGSREIAEPFFLESSTGRQYSTSDSNFVGLESVFSSNNYWVNMQSCENKLTDISFDLGDNSKWEYVFLNNTHPIPIKKIEEDEEEEKEKSDVLEIPASWLYNLVVTTEQYEAKCPTGHKATVYKNATHEIYNDYHRPDGMVARITIHPSRSTKNEIHEIYKFREDMLQRRIRIPDEDKIIEHFDHCKNHHLKQHTLIHNKTKKLLFYDFFRHDGLHSRTYFDKKVIEIYVDREDKLVYRSVTFTDLTMKNVRKIAEKYARNESLPAARDIAKKTFFISEERMKIVYHLEKGSLFPVHREFRKPNLDIKSESIVQILDSFEPKLFPKPISKRILHEDVYDLLRDEEIVHIEIKKMDREIEDLLAERKAEEEHVVLTVSVLDTIRNEEIDPASEEKKKEQEKEEEEIKSAELNYLSPYLISYSDPQNLTKEEALAVKDACLKSHKDRVLERIGIIQSRLEELNGEYQKRQLIFSKTSDMLSVAETEEHTNFCNDILFKIHILEKRLVKCKEGANEKYTKLDKKLKADLKLI